jgi:hypothetical protein
LCVENGGLKVNWKKLALKAAIIVFVALTGYWFNVPGMWGVWW